MKFFAKFVFLCNICFVLAALLRFVEMGRTHTGNLDPAIGYQPLQATLIVLGYSAIFFSIAFLFVFSYRKLLHRPILLPKWLLLVNLVMLPVQVWYFLFPNF